MHVRMGPSTKMEHKRKPDPLEELVPKLNQYCHFLTKDKWDGEDIAQETIVRALKHYENQEDWSASLLKKIAYHLWIDRMRKHEKESLLSHGELPEKADNSNGEICSDLVEELSKQLTPKQLVSFVLKEAFQYKIAEIADVMDMSETGVKSLLNRARVNIKRLPDNNKESCWPEEANEILYPALSRSITLQDPTDLIGVVSKIFTHSAHPYKAFHKSPSNVLSLAS